MATACLDEDVLNQLLEGRLAESARAAAEEHLDGCARCRHLLALAAPDDDDGAETASVPSPEALATAATLDARVLPADPRAIADGLARYVVGERLATLDDGALHAGLDRRLRRDLIIQLVAPAPAGTLARLRERARIHARVDHPGVARIVEVGEDGGRAYLVLEIADATPLARAAADMSLDEQVRVLRDVAVALHAAHEAGAEHGALTAAAVLVERGDDTGPAPRLLGLRPAATPERAADVHGLGGLVYGACAGAPPVTTDGAEPPPLREVSARAPADLAAVAARCLRAAPEARYATALDVARELDRYLDGEPVLARGPRRLGRARGWLRRHRAWLAAAAVVGVAVAGAGVASLLADRAERGQVVREQLAIGLGAEQAASRLCADADEQRADAVARFHAGDDALAERAWARATDGRARCQLEYARAERAFEAALVWDPDRADVRAALARALAEQAVVAGDRRDAARQADLLARLALYDRGQRQLRAFTAPPTLAIETRPTGAAIEVVRQVADPRGRLVDQPVATVAAPATLDALAPGSYLLIARAPGRDPVRAPLVLAPAAEQRVALELPRAGALPPSMIYVPAGDSYAGSDAESTRAITEAMPLHRVSTAAFLIARTETTVAAWLEYLDALPADERERRRPRARHFGRAIELVAVAGGWAYRVEDAAGWSATARAGEPLVHPRRTRRAAQDWRRFPVAGVSQGDALAYLAWLDRTGRVPGARLCSELELERAARGADDRPYPPGAALEPDDANLLATYGAEGVGLDEVGAHPGGRSVFGVDDLIGNASELAASPAEARALAVGGENFSDATAAAIGRRSLLPRGFRAPAVTVRVCAAPGSIF